MAADLVAESVESVELVESVESVRQPDSSQLASRLIKACNILL